MKVEQVFAPTPDRRRAYQAAADLSPTPPAAEAKTVGVDKVTISPEGKERAAEWRDEQARRLVRRPGPAIDIEAASTAAIAPVKR